MSVPIPKVIEVPIPDSLRKLPSFRITKAFDFVINTWISKTTPWRFFKPFNWEPVDSFEELGLTAGDLQFIAFGLMEMPMFEKLSPAGLNIISFPRYYRIVGYIYDYKLSPDALAYESGIKIHTIIGTKWGGWYTKWSFPIKPPITRYWSFRINTLLFKIITCDVLRLYPANDC